MSILRIYFSGNWRDGNSPCAWALCDDGGALLQSGNDPLAALPKGHDCIGIAAADRVLLLAIQSPPGSRRRWQAALPFAVEERTLPDPEDNHVVPGTALDDGRVAVAVVDKAWIRRIVEAAQAAGLSLRRMVVETLLPQRAPQAWTLVWDGVSGFVRTADAGGMALDGGDADHAPLALSLNAGALPPRIEVRVPHPATAQTLPQWRDLPATTLAAGQPWDWRTAPIPADAWNMLWGEFAPRARIREWWPALRPAALILLAALGVETLGANLQWAMLAHEKSAIQNSMAQNFRAAFGADGVLVNAPLQMQRNLADLRHATGNMDDGDLLPLLDAAAPVVAALPAVTAQSLHYESGRLDLDVKAARAADLQTLRQRLQEKGLNARIGEIHDSGSSAETRLSITAGVAP